MRNKTIYKLNEKFDINFSTIQIKSLKKIIYNKNNKKSFLQYINILLSSRFKHNCNVSDFYEIKKILIECVNDNHHIQNINTFIKRYGRTKGAYIYNEYVKSKTKNWKPDSYDTKSLDFHIKKYGEKLGIKKYKKSCYNNGKSLRVEHWLDKGYTFEESKLLLKERQTTFSLKKCIKKYGKELGVQRWKERQDKWQNTLKAKSQDEIADINRRKSSGIGRYLDKTVPGRIYYIHFYNDDINFWKIGITTLTADKRFNLNTFKNRYDLNYDIIFENELKTIQQAYNLEQKILTMYNENRITIDFNKFATTEAFNKNVLKEFYENNI